MSALGEIRFHHVRSVVDVSSIARLIARGLAEDPICGQTEWAAPAFHRELSIGWDWAVVRSLIVMLNPAGIRTNVQLIGEHGQIESPLRARIHLLEHVETLPWRLFVQRVAFS